MRELSDWGAAVMDHSRTAAAYDAGVRRAALEAAYLGSVWAS